MEERYCAGGQAPKRRNSRQHVHALSDARIDIYDFAIQGGDLVYSVEETKKSGGISGGLLRQTIGNRAAHSPKPGCKLVVNDTVMYAEDGAILLVIDLDQKVCKLEITGRERVKQEPKASETTPAK